MRIEVAGRSAKIYGLTPQAIGAEPQGASTQAKQEAIASIEQELAFLLSQEPLPVPIQNAINNLLRAGVQFVLGSDAPGDTYFRSASGPVARLPIGANGKILGVNAGLPAWMDTPAAVMWSEVTGTAQAAAINSGYIANNVALVTITLPATAPVGSILVIVGAGTGGWRLSQGAGQRVHFGNVSSANGATGHLLSTHQRDCVRLVCTVANAEWQVYHSLGNIDIPVV